MLAKVSARNAYGPSQLSLQSNAEVLPDSLAPIIGIENVEENSMTVSFEAIEGIEYYYINVYEKDTNGNLVFVKQVPVPLDSIANGRRLAEKFYYPSQEDPNSVYTDIHDLRHSQVYAFSAETSFVKSEPHEAMTQIPGTPDAAKGLYYNPEAD